MPLTFFNNVTRYKVQFSELKVNKKRTAGVFTGSTHLRTVSLIHLKVNMSEEWQKNKVKVKQATSKVLILV